MCVQYLITVVVVSILLPVHCYLCLFSGGTEEYGVMVDKLMKQYTSSLFIAVGFSMGGNIITKFLGTHPEIQKNFIGAVSCCQGYDVNEYVNSAVKVKKKCFES